MRLCCRVKLWKPTEKRSVHLLILFPRYLGVLVVFHSCVCFFFFSHTRRKVSIAIEINVDFFSRRSFLPVRSQRELSVANSFLANTLRSYGRKKSDGVGEVKERGNALAVKSSVLTAGVECLLVLSLRVKGCLVCPLSNYNPAFF